MCFGLLFNIFFLRISVGSRTRRRTRTGCVVDDIDRCRCVASTSLLYNAAVRIRGDVNKATTEESKESRFLKCKCCSQEA